MTKMISLKKGGTPLLDGLYLAHQGTMYQIRLKGTQEVLSSVTNFEDAVRCGKNLIVRYRTVERAKEHLGKGEHLVPENELVRRIQEESTYTGNKICKEFINRLSPTKGEEDSLVKRKRVKLVW